MNHTWEQRVCIHITMSTCPYIERPFFSSCDKGPSKWKACLRVRCSEPLSAAVRKLAQSRQPGTIFHVGLAWVSLWTWKTRGKIYDYQYEVRSTTPITSSIQGQSIYLLPRCRESREENLAYNIIRPRQEAKIGSEYRLCNSAAVIARLDWTIVLKKLEKRKSGEPMVCDYLKIGKHAVQTGKRLVKARRPQTDLLVHGDARQGVLTSCT
ncbi:hypothetical protein V8C37DRAFT_210145 [Trichoderma ceciliae]